MLHALQARLAMTACEGMLRSTVESVVMFCQSARTCAAPVFMAGCENAPHPAMSERIGRRACLKGALCRAAPALDPRPPAVSALHVPQVQRPCPPALRAGGPEAGEASVSGGLGRVDLPS
jgi:hypothetical protein